MSPTVLDSSHKLNHAVLVLCDWLIWLSKMTWLHLFNKVQLLNQIWPFATPLTAARQASLSITNSQNLLKLMSIESMMPPSISSSVVPFSSCLQSFPAWGSFPMNQFFPSGGQSIGAFSFSASPSNEYSGLSSFRIDWFDIPVVQGTLRSLL